jgi:Histidine kinase-, DNA gyrase B-, and HSP90-like ATPase
LGRYEQLKIWKTNIGGRRGSASDKREQLRASYRQFWNNAVTLSREIQRDLPQLTLHDEAHFEALWERADQIAGENYQLTPLEVFVFGGAILLHDAANCLAAYPGRLAEVQATPEWRDAIAEWLERSGQDATGPIPEDVQRNVLLETLRSIHAERARTLASFVVNVGSDRHALLQDDQLRLHVGPLIGEIAASHHWDISTLQRRLGGPRGSLAGMPQDWIIRPVLLACLLRCADATQLDQDRAPDFLYGLLQLHGISESHWRAQRRLAHPHVDPHEPSALVFTSTQSFSEADAHAWWIAHDAIQVANRELQASNNLLRDLRLPAFQVSRVHGAESPDRLSTYLRVEGWRPVLAEVKVTRVDKIVDMFGGEQLYGRQMSVPIRELIQNSADAVRFRRELEPASSGYEGRITVRLREDHTDSDVWIDVEDDGIGMSEAVVTGPLIDFGSSYISSSLVKSERPGLLSKGRKRIGKYGVGFFSTFMITDEVSVTSKPFDAGLDACRTLRFTHGAVTRPILLSGVPANFSPTLSTRITLRLSRAQLAEVLMFDRPFRGEPKFVDMRQLVGMLCPMLDVDVFVCADGRTERVHSRRWYDEERTTWLKRIALPMAQDRAGRDAEISEAAGRLTPIDPEDPAAGLAAVSGVSAMGIATVGTLRATERLSEHVDEFAGAIDYEPSGPRRDMERPRAAARLPLWATEQAALAASTVVPQPQRQRIAERVAKFGGDATPIASILFNREWVPLEEAFSKSLKEGTVYIPITWSMRQEGRPVMTTVRERHTGFVDNYFQGELELVLPTLEGSDSSSYEDYYSIPTDDHPADCSFYAMLNKVALCNGFYIEGEFCEKIEFARYVGQDSPRQKLHHGKMIGCAGLKLTFLRQQEP